MTRAYHVLTLLLAAASACAVGAGMEMGDRGMTIAGVVFAWVAAMVATEAP